MIGFACKFSESKLVSAAMLEQLANRTVTAKWIQENPDDAADRIDSILKHNLSAFAAALVTIKTFPESMRMYRFSLDLFPLLSHATYYTFYQDPARLALVKSTLHRLGNYARLHGIKLSMHPGQFTVLNSDKDLVREASVAEIEAHAMIAFAMGYGTRKLDFKINVHLNGKGGKAAFRKSYKQLSLSARNMLTVENDEFSCGLDETLAYAQEFHLGMVLDLHHHWVSTGEYLHPSDVRVQHIVDTWAGARPTLHYSNSTAEALAEGGHTSNLMRPVMKDLIEAGAKSSQLRKHSNGLPNIALNSWALTFADKFDIMCEAKDKNAAAETLHRLYMTQEEYHINHET